MNARETAGCDTGGLMITVRSVKDKPKYKKTAAALLARCREFYQDPENERAFREWMAGKEERHDERACG